MKLITTFPLAHYDVPTVGTPAAPRASDGRQSHYAIWKKCVRRCGRTACIDQLTDPGWDVVAISSIGIWPFGHQQRDLCADLEIVLSPEGVAAD